MDYFCIFVLQFRGICVTIQRTAQMQTQSPSNLLTTEDFYEIQ